MEKETIKNECIRRMKTLKISKTCIDDFIKNDEVWTSESIGILYWLEDEEKEIVAKFEKEHKGLKVYHCIRNMTAFGRLLTLLYVNGRSQEEFDEDKAYFDNDMTEEYNGGYYLMSYVENLDDEFSCEFGSVGVKSMNGGLKRVG